MKRRLLIVIFAIISTFSAYSGPARKGIIYLQQPDKTSFPAILRGDEFMKIMTTAEGHAVVQDEDGWWCYARYDDRGRKSATEWHVGQGTPEHILSASRIIPYGTLQSNARMKRNTACGNEDAPLMARVLKQQGTDTKGDTESPVIKHGIIILAQFKDVKFTYSREDFVSMLTQTGYSVNGATGSAKEYFDAQFNGTFEFGFDISGIVTLPATMASYGGNDSDDSDRAPAQMIIDACRLADPEVDFSLYDDDKDGTVDNVFVFFAGGDEADGAGSDCIWSHAWYIYSGAGQEITHDGKRIDRYACTSELSRRYSGNSYRDVLAGIGTFCHEYFHTFGIPDMYDTDYEGSGGYSAGLWGWTSLMDAGNQNNYGNTPPYLNAIEREYLGISGPVIIEEDGGYTLDPIHRNGRYYRMNTDNEDEYYLLECRSEEGWDKYVGGSGMLVYHIDKSARSTGYSDSYGRDMTAMQRWTYANEINCRPEHQCADLIEADMRQDSFTEADKGAFSASLKNIRGVFFPNGDIKSIEAAGTPGFSFWSGQPAKASVTNIKKNGESISFNVIGYSEAEAPPSATEIRIEAFMDAAIISFESDRAFEGEASLAWGRTGQEMDTLSVTPYEAGKYAATLEGLQPGNKTYTVEIFFEVSGLTGESASASFMTKKSPVVDWPFIYMNGVPKNSDGTLPKASKLPLRVYNAGDAAEIIWKFNDKVIRTGGDGYFTVTESGELKACIIWEDGSEETIMKEIIIGKEGVQ